MDEQRSTKLQIMKTSSTEWAKSRYTVIYILYTVYLLLAYLIDVSD